MMKQDCKLKNTNGVFFEKIEYDDNSQDVYLVDGMPIIARKNCKELDIFNNEMFIIKNIQYEKQKIIITDDDNKIVDIHFDDFQKLFYIKQLRELSDIKCGFHKKDQPQTF